MSRKNQKVAIVIPAYNEGTHIRKVVKGVKKSVSAKGFNCSVIVVDDGSRDNTSAEAKLGGAYVIRHILNTGAGGATATGLSYAEQKGYTIAVTLDADGQHDPRDVSRGVSILSQGDVDLLIGSRLIDNKGMSRVKVLGNKGLSLITNLLFGVRTTDSQSGLRVYSRKALEKLHWKTSGYEFCSEMLWRASQQNLKIDEYPIRAIYSDYSIAKGQNNWNAVNIIKSLVIRRLSEFLR